MFKRAALIVLVAAASLLAGCGTFGHTSYEVSCKQMAPGAGNACDLKASDGKEFTSRTIQFNAASGVLVVQEGESKAFAGQAIGAKAMTVLPVTGLDDLVPASHPVIIPVAPSR